MLSTSLKRVAIAAAGLAVAVVVAGPAGALDVHPKQVQTEVRFLELDRNTFREFGGRIDAGFKECEDDRDVDLLYRATPTSTPQVLGTGETNGKGVFVIELGVQAVAGEYAVEVGKSRERAHRHGDTIKLVCRPVVSAFTHF